MPTITWTDPTVVKRAINSRTSLTDAQLTAMITETMYAISTIMKTQRYVDDTVAWDDKYAVLRQAATAHVAMKVLASTSESIFSLTELATMLNVNYANYREAMKLLEDQDYVNYLGSI